MLRLTKDAAADDDDDGETGNHAGASAPTSTKAPVTAEAEHYSVPLVRLDITQKIKTWDAPSGIPGPIRRLMSVSASVEDTDDDHDAAVTDDVPMDDDDDADDDARIATAFSAAGRATPPVEMEAPFDPRAVEEDEMIETLNIWDMPIFQVADKVGNFILSQVSAMDDER